MIPGFRHKTIKARTLGQKLRAKRQREQVTLEEAEAATQVRAKFLEALEKNDFLSLPSDVYTIGFLERYASFLGLPKEKIISQFKEEKQFFLFSNNRGKDSFDLKPRKKINFVITPKILLISVVVLSVLVILAYIIYSLRDAMQPPKLVLTKPATSETMAAEENFTFAGDTEAGAVLIINAQPISIDGKGHFEQTVHLQEGLNIFELKTTNRLKRENSKVIKILFKK